MFRLNHLFKRADAVQRHLAAPLARSRLAYLAHRAEQGAKSSTLRGIAALQVKLVFDSISGNTEARIQQNHDLRW